MYAVIEIQDTKTEVSTLSFGFETEAEANQKFYEILWYASASNVPIHGAVLIGDGYLIKSDRIEHPVAEPPIEE